MMHFTHRIKDADYKISLIFFGLSSKEDSLSRVIQRYTMGGHNVNQDVIEYNFTKGIKRVRASLPLFENILFIDGTSDFGDIVAIHIEKSGKHQITDHPAEWFDKYFKDAFDALIDGEEELFFYKIPANHFIPNPPHIDDSDIFIGR